MKKRMALTYGVLLTGLLAAPVLAAEDGAVAAPQEDGAAQGAEVGKPGTVPQAQLDIFKKREEARKRRDEALKVRQQMLQTGN